MKRWNIETSSRQYVYRTYSVDAETKEEALRLFHAGEGDCGEADYGDEDDETVDTITMECDLLPEDQQLDEGI